MRVGRRARSANRATASDPAAPGPVTRAGQAPRRSRNRASPATATAHGWSPASAHHRRPAARRTASPRRRHVLAVIQHQQQLLTGQHPRQRLDERHARRLAQAQRHRDRRGTRAGSCTGASSISHTPSANRPATRRATSPASRVLPTPPGPVTVTRRHSPSRPAASSTDHARPTKLVSRRETMHASCRHDRRIAHARTITAGHRHRKPTNQNTGPAPGHAHLQPRPTCPSMQTPEQHRATIQPQASLYIRWARSTAGSAGSRPRTSHWLAFISADLPARQRQSQRPGARA